MLEKRAWYIYLLCHFNLRQIQSVFSVKMIEWHLLIYAVQNQKVVRKRSLSIAFTHKPDSGYSY